MSGCSSDRSHADLDSESFVAVGIDDVPDPQLTVVPFPPRGLSGSGGTMESWEWHVDRTGT